MAIVEAHGYKFAVTVPHVDEKSLEFASFAHNLRQELLALTPETIASLHKSEPIQTDTGIASPLERLGGLAAIASGLGNSRSVEIRPVKS